MKLIIDKGLVITVMTLSEYQAKKKRKLKQYKQSPEYQLWSDNNK